MVQQRDNGEAESCECPTVPDTVAEWVCVCCGARRGWTGWLGSEWFPLLLSCVMAAWGVVFARDDLTAVSQTKQTLWANSLHSKFNILSASSLIRHDFIQRWWQISACYFCQVTSHKSAQCSGTVSCRNTGNMSWALCVEQTLNKKSSTKIYKLYSMFLRCKVLYSLCRMFNKRWEVC